MRIYFCLPTQCHRQESLAGILEHRSFSVDFRCKKRLEGILETCYKKKTLQYQFGISLFYWMYLIRVKSIRLEHLHKRRWFRRHSDHVQLLHSVIVILVIIDLVWIYITSSIWYLLINIVSQIPHSIIATCSIVVFSHCAFGYYRPRVDLHNFVYMITADNYCKLDST